MNDTATVHLQIPTSLTAETVQKVAEDMRGQQVERHKYVHLDFSETNILTSPGMQLLLSLEKTLSETGGIMVVSEVKSALREVFCDLGFERLLRKES